MKIIQSFSLLKKNGTYDITYNENIYINLYVFLLSFLTLKKYYGEVIMYCDQPAYDKFIKFIPYDKIIIKENEYIEDEGIWNLYKVSIISEQKESFIHVDTDVFIFDSIFDKFINEDYELICQEVLYGRYNPRVDNFINNETLLFEKGLIKDDFVDGFASCGVIGFKNDLNSIENYNKMANIMISLYKEDKLFSLKHTVGLLIEEFTFHMLQQYYKYNLTTVLNQDIVNEHGPVYASQFAKYTHLWFKSKYVEEYINLIKLKIKTDFPEYSKLVDKYDIIMKHGATNFKFDYKKGVNVDEYLIKQNLYEFKKWGII